METADKALWQSRLHDKETHRASIQRALVTARGKVKQSMLDCTLVLDHQIAYCKKQIDAT